MKQKTYVISSLLLAGFGQTAGAQQAAPAVYWVGKRENDADLGAAVELFRQERPMQLVGHSSHSSHASHSSHSSHSSGSSGGLYSPSPVYTPPIYTPTPTPAPRRIDPTPSAPTTGSSNRSVSPLFGSPQPVTRAQDGYVDIVRRVQRGLKAFGYYNGAADGALGPEMKGALTKFQTEFGLKVTGTITPEVLKSLQISM